MDTQAIDGLPLPQWTSRGTQAELERLIGQDFRFHGQGWYVLPDQVLLIHGDTLPVRGLDQLSQLLKVVRETDDTRYSCHSWTSDPRPALQEILTLDNQTEVSVPELLVVGWPQVEVAANELLAWGRKVLAETARERGVDLPAEALESLRPVGACPTTTTKERVETGRGGPLGYAFGSFVLHPLDGDQLVELRRSLNGKEVPSYARVCEIPGHPGAVIVTFRPKR